MIQKFFPSVMVSARTLSAGSYGASTRPLSPHRYSVFGCASNESGAISGPTSRYTILIIPSSSARAIMGSSRAQRRRWGFMRWIVAVVDSDFNRPAVQPHDAGSARMRFRAAVLTPTDLRNQKSQYVDTSWLPVANAPKLHDGPPALLGR